MWQEPNVPSVHHHLIIVVGTFGKWPSPHYSRQCPKINSMLTIITYLHQITPKVRNNYPCAFFSCGLSPTEGNYDIGDQEVIKLALEEWRHWLEEANYSFSFGLTIRTWVTSELPRIWFPIRNAMSVAQPWSKPGEINSHQCVVTWVTRWFEKQTSLGSLPWKLNEKWHLADDWMNHQPITVYHMLTWTN